jgi:hypothetical protein
MALITYGKITIFILETETNKFPHVTEMLISLTLNLLLHTECFFYPRTNRDGLTA